MLSLRLIWSVLVLAALPVHATVQPARGKGQEDVLTSLAGLSAGRIETRHLTVTVSSKPASAAPGSRITLLVEVVPKPKMHVYAPEQQDLIPVSLSLKPQAGTEPLARRFPPSEAYFFAPLKETQRVYSRPFRIEQDVRIADTPALRRRAAAAGGTLSIDAVLRYQACDDAVCYLPQDVPLSWSIPLVPRR